MTPAGLVNILAGYIVSNLLHFTQFICEETEKSLILI
jgi:hypothetical protein